MMWSLFSIYYSIENRKHLFAILLFFSHRSSRTIYCTDYGILLNRNYYQFDSSLDGPSRQTTMLLLEQNGPDVSGTHVLSTRASHSCKYRVPRSCRLNLFWYKLVFCTRATYVFLRAYKICNTEQLRLLATLSQTVVLANHCSSIMIGYIGEDNILWFWLAAFTFFYFDKVELSYLDRAFIPLSYVHGTQSNEYFRAPLLGKYFTRRVKLRANQDR